MDFHGKFNYSIPNLIPTPNASSLQASKPLVASAGIAKRNQFPWKSIKSIDFIESMDFHGINGIH